MKELIYKHSTHSLNYAERCNVNSYSLTIIFLELIFDYDTDSLIGVQGFLPLLKAERCGIQIPKSTKGIYQLTNIDKTKIKKGNIYDYFSVVGASQCDNNKVKVKYDEKEGIIELDILSTGKDASFITVSKNLVCSVDNTGVLLRVYIKPDYFTK